MALYATDVGSHVIDILYYTAKYDNWGIGIANCKYNAKQIANRLLCVDYIKIKVPRI